MHTQALVRWNVGAKGPGMLVNVSLPEVSLGSLTSQGRTSAGGNSAKRPNSEDHRLHKWKC